MAQELRTASIAIQRSLPSKYQDVSNERLTELAKQLRVSTLHY